MADYQLIFCSDNQTRLIVDDCLLFEGDLTEHLSDIAQGLRPDGGQLLTKTHAIKGHTLLKRLDGGATIVRPIHTWPGESRMAVSRITVGTLFALIGERQ